MPITLPTRQPDGSTLDVDYLDVNELAPLLHMHPVTIRRKLADREWQGSRIGGRWYMTRDDIADAIALCHHERQPRLTDLVADDDQEGDRARRLGVVVTDEQLDSVRGVR